MWTKTLDVNLFFRKRPQWRILSNVPCPMHAFLRATYMYKKSTLLLGLYATAAT